MNRVWLELEIMHDVHECPSLIDTLAFAKELEPFRLFFLEDSVCPDQVEYLKYPANDQVDFGWMFSRLPDGTAVRS